MTVTYLQPFADSAIPLEEFHNFLRNEYRGYLILNCSQSNQIELSYDLRSSLKNIEFNHPVVVLLKQIITEIPYGPNCVGLLLSFCLQNVLRYCSYDIANTSKIIQKLFCVKQLAQPLIQTQYKPPKSLLDTLNSSTRSFYQSKLQSCIDFDSICRLAKQTLTSVCCAINFDLGVSGQVFVTPFKASFTCFSVKGLSLDIKDRHVDRRILSDFNNSRQIPVLLIFDVIENDSDALLSFVSKAQIKIVVCQKVICPQYKVEFRRNGILALERTGQEFIETLKKISNASPTDFKNGMIGELTHVQLGVMGFETLLLFENSNAFVTTLCVGYGSSLMTSDQLKSVIGQAVKLCYTIVNGSSTLPSDSISRALASIKSTDGDIRAVLAILSNGVSHWERAFSLCADTSGISSKSWLFPNSTLEFLIDTMINILNVGMIIKKK